MSKKTKSKPNTNGSAALFMQSLQGVIADSITPQLEEMREEIRLGQEKTEEGQEKMEAEMKRMREVMSDGFKTHKARQREIIKEEVKATRS